MDIEKVYLSQDNIKALFNTLNSKVSREYGEKLKASYIPNIISIMKEELHLFDPDMNVNSQKNIQDLNVKTLKKLLVSYNKEVESKKMNDIQVLQPINSKNKQKLPENVPSYNQLVGNNNSMSNGLPTMPPVGMPVMAPPAGNAVPDFLKPVKTREETPSPEEMQNRPKTLSEKNDNSDVMKKFAEMNNLITNEPSPTNSSSQQVNQPGLSSEIPSFDDIQETPIDAIAKIESTITTDSDLVKMLKDFLETFKTQQENFIDIVGQNLNKYKSVFLDMVQENKNQYSGVLEKMTEDNNKLLEELLKKPEEEPEEEPEEQFNKVIYISSKNSEYTFDKYVDILFVRLLNCSLKIEPSDETIIEIPFYIPELNSEEPFFIFNKINNKKNTTFSYQYSDYPIEKNMMKENIINLSVLFENVSDYFFTFEIIYKNSKSDVNLFNLNDMRTMLSQLSNNIVQQTKKAEIQQVIELKQDSEIEIQENNEEDIILDIQENNEPVIEQVEETINRLPADQ